MKFIFPIATLLFLAGCSGSSTGIFTQKTAKEKYESKLEKSGNGKSAEWARVGNYALQNPFKTPANYIEKGFFGKNLPEAAAYQFKAEAGQKIEMNFIGKTNKLNVYMELWEQIGNNAPKLILSADTIHNYIGAYSYDGGNYILRIQPEWGDEGFYTLRIATSPMLGWPIIAGAKSNIGSVWGDPRDGGARRHEGIDIMAAKGTNLVAVADGTIEYAGEDDLGGKVVSLKANGHPFSAYYAHLNEQMVTSGQKVKKGDIIGTVGNTGNARTTPPHLHFGIYFGRMAKNPMAFVKQVKGAENPNEKYMVKIGHQAIVNKGFKINQMPLSSSEAVTLTGKDTLYIKAVSDSYARVETPGRQYGFVKLTEFRL